MVRSIDALHGIQHVHGTLAALHEVCSYIPGHFRGCHATVSRRCKVHLVNGRSGRSDRTRSRAGPGPGPKLADGPCNYDEWHW